VICALTRLNHLALASVCRGSDGAPRSLRPFSRLCELARLQRVALDSNCLGDGDVKWLGAALAPLTRLSRLGLAGNRFTSRGALRLADALRPLTRLASLEMLSRKVLRDAVADVAARLHGARDLVLHGRAFCDVEDGEDTENAEASPSCCPGTPVRAKVGPGQLETTAAATR
jgi:hypothetical protein